MPIYEYQCLQCGTRSEALQKMSDPPLTTCEACGGDLKRLVSSPAVQFKGSGWYVTDYARRGGGKGAAGEGKGETKGDSSAAASTSGGGESKGDKPAAASGASTPSGGAKAD